ncbi:MAG: hypothetical protein A2Z27_05530 [candidate division Zixibacteria bacterium RBG_16_50_21]|nr:MAG: hypothetical protein A2Z27_05530 [candidate division Zixibacteria bacterium RBG_16_50_21]
MLQSFEHILEEIKQGFLDFVEFLPYLLLAILVALAGWLIAGVIRRIVVALLSFLFARQQAEVPGALSPERQERMRRIELVASLFYWSAIFVTLVLFLNTLGLQIGQEISSRLLDIIPRILVASLVLILGMVFAVLVEQVSRFILQKARTENYLLWSRILKWATVAFTILMALEQLGIAAQVVVAIIQISVAAVALSLALAFGLGCKDIARDIVIELFRREEKAE